MADPTSSWYSGADAQVQVNFQVMVGLVDFGLDPQQAVESARWQSMQPGTERSWPHDSDELVIEDRVPAPSIAELRKSGHTVRVVGPLDGPCSVNVLRREVERWQAGSDPRRDGYAAAF